MFVQKQFQVEIESTKQLPRANTPIDYSILNKYEILKITNMKFQELQLCNFKNYNFVISFIYTRDNLIKKFFCRWRSNTTQGMIQKIVISNPSYIRFHNQF